MLQCFSRCGHGFHCTPRHRQCRARRRNPLVGPAVRVLG
ncbi:hypothetical protein STXM2123_3168 [Streptomyces sp. F-3]|nr:hypothetical protein STXM2123_3168 [Streptomyces sp. F-3]